MTNVDKNPLLLIRANDAQLIFNMLLRYPAGEVIAGLDILRTLSRSPVQTAEDRAVAAPTVPPVSKPTPERVMEFEAPRGLTEPM